MTPEELQLLNEERQGKTERPAESETFREKIIEGIEDWYEKNLKWWMEKNGRRRLLIWGPVILTVLSFVFLVPRIAGGSLFPADDSPFITITVSAPPGTDQSSLIRTSTIDGIPVENRLNDFDEIKFSTFKFNDNSLTIFIELLSTTKRKTDNMRLSDELEPLFLERLQPLRTAGLDVVIQAAQNGPPTGSAVSIKLLADQTDKLTDLKRVVRDFENYLKNLEGTKNVTNTSQDGPGEIVFTVNRERAAIMGVSPLQIYGEISNFSR